MAEIKIKVGKLWVTPSEIEKVFKDYDKLLKKTSKKQASDCSKTKVK